MKLRRTKKQPLFKRASYEDEVFMKYEKEIQASVDYLYSDLALKTVDTDAYWPKWNAPWWHILLLHEMGEVKRVPKNMRVFKSLSRSFRF
jgi:hypothetical protein